MRFPQIALSLASIPLLSLLSFGANQASCTFKTFSAPSGYVLAQVNGIDDSGTVVGALQDKSGMLVAFTRDSSGKFTLFKAPNSAMTWFSRRASSVNVGSFQDKAFPAHMHGFAQQGGNFTAVNYPKATNTWLTGINKAGTVVGNFLANPASKGFMLTNGKYTVIARSGALSTNPQAVNDSGVVVGYYTTSTHHGFIWKGGNLTVVDHPRAVYGTMLTDVNGTGVVVGNYLAGDHAFGFIYKNNTFANVVYAGAKSASVGGINGNGVIAGQIFYSLTNTPGYTAVCK